MTIPTITDDQLAEIEREARDDIQDAYGFTNCNPKKVLDLIARVRELEKDAARYRDMLIKAGRWVPMSDDSCHCEDCAEQSELVAAIDAAMLAAKETEQ